MLKTPQREEEKLWQCNDVEQQRKEGKNQAVEWRELGRQADVLLLVVGCCVLCCLL